MVKENDKLEIDDIKDPLDEAEAKEESLTPSVQDPNKSADVDLEEVVAEDPEEKDPKKKVDSSEPKTPADNSDPDKLEKAIEESNGVREKEPKATKNKKFPWKTLAIVVVTFLVTAALILGGYFVYQKYSKPAPKAEDSTMPATETPSAKTVETQKTVYTTAEPTLNLRKDPSTTAPILAKIPYGTKLTVLETQGSWYKVTYSSQTGWIDSTYTGAENPLIYKNSTYSFQINFLPDWGGYKFFPIASHQGATEAWYVALPTSDSAYTAESGVDKGYASLFALTVYSPDQWAAAQKEEGPKPTLAAQNQQWVVAYSLPNGIPPKDLAAQAAEAKSIISTLKFY